jgi:hypothetical protein
MEAVATDAVVHTMVAEEIAVRLEGCCKRPFMPANGRGGEGEYSEAAMVWGQMHQLANGVHTLECRFKDAWEATGLGEVELPRQGELPPGELYLLPSKVILGDLLAGLDGVLRRAVEDSSRALDTEAVQFGLSSPGSCVPDLPLEEVLERVIPGYERDRIRGVAEGVVDSFALAATADPPVGDDADPVA